MKQKAKTLLKWKNDYLIKNIKIKLVKNINRINTIDPKTPPIILADEVPVLSVITGVGQCINYTFDYSSLPSIFKNITMVLLTEGRSIYEYTLMV